MTTPFVKQQNRGRVFPSFGYNGANCCQSFSLPAGRAGERQFWEGFLTSVSAGRSELMLLEESSSSMMVHWEAGTAQSRLIHTHLAYFWLCWRDSVPEGSESKDQAERSRKAFQLVTEPLGAVIHAVRAGALPLAPVGVTELLTAAFAGRRIILHPRSSFLD